ncbi:hypothetical protein BD410DRAFT_817582 [Rickenella mellea]|uniref:Uncharacterized protein n=1 Tax=Rickenella mellea TaxID=50990 RepID=A0A4R5XEG6_9AGAM|nr:hypothetical protein BD410DRAFT_817582 [Rickenella mellea]
MGFTGLARWVNAPTTGLDLVKQNIQRNQGGIERGRWSLSVRSLRSTFSGSIPNFQPTSERALCALTMNNSVFVLIDDPAVPFRWEFTQSIAQAEAQYSASATVPDGSDATNPQGQANPPPFPHIPEPPHYRSTFLTVSPPNALEQLLGQLRARWTSTRQTSSSTGRGQNQPTSGHQLVIEGSIFTIGNDWLIKVGNVLLAGGALKGMLLEAEYLPLTVLRPQHENEAPELVSNLLASILPNIPNARTVAITISEAQWEEVLWKRSEPGDEEEKAEDQKMDDDDPYIFENEEDAMDNAEKDDWVGIDRDRRSAFLIIAALKNEGIL